MCTTKVLGFFGRASDNRPSKCNLIMLLTCFVLAASFLGISFGVNLDDYLPVEIVLFGAKNGNHVVIFSAYFTFLVGKTAIISRFVDNIFNDAPIVS